jgi:hypothetical protein
MNTRPIPCLLVQGGETPMEDGAQIVSANTSFVQIRCAAAVQAQATVQLKLRDGVVLGRVTDACRGLVRISVDHVTSTVPPLSNLASALAAPVRVDSGASVPDEEEAGQLVNLRRMPRSRR